MTCSNPKWAARAEILMDLGYHGPTHSREQRINEAAHWLYSGPSQQFGCFSQVSEGKRTMEIGFSIIIKEKTSF